MSEAKADDGVRIVALAMHDFGTVHGSETVSVKARSHFWLLWGEIAIEQLELAKAHRVELTAHLRDPSNSHLASQSLNLESKAAMISISAAAHAINAWYGAVWPYINPDKATEERARKSRLPGSRKTLERLKSGFDVGSKSHRWFEEWEWLFGLRGAAVHFVEDDRDPSPHPTGQRTTPENVSYSVESAERAVHHLTDLLTTCQARPRPEMARLAEYVKQFEGTISDMRQQLTRANDEVEVRPG